MLRESLTTVDTNAEIPFIHFLSHLNYSYLDSPTEAMKAIKMIADLSVDKINLSETSENYTAHVFFRDQLIQTTLKSQELINNLNKNIFKSLFSPNKTQVALADLKNSFLKNWHDQGFSHHYIASPEVYMQALALLEMLYVLERVSVNGHRFSIELNDCNMLTDLQYMLKARTDDFARLQPLLAEKALNDIKTWVNPPAINITAFQLTLTYRD